jgi:hypothetical protein
VRPSRDLLVCGELALIGMCIAIGSGLLSFALDACGTPLAPKEVCVMWAHVTPDGGLELPDASDAGKE